MPCPYCGYTKTEVLEIVYRRHNCYRYRRCLGCGARFGTQESPVRGSRVDQKWPGSKPTRRDWRQARKPALQETCEVATCGAVFERVVIPRHVDHIVPVRLIQRLNAGNPHRRENLQCICGVCHGYKREADHKLCLGDKLGYLEILRVHNFDMAHVERALAIYGL